MIYEYKIRIVSGDNMIMISPEIIALTIEKVRNADSKELIVPVEEILSQGYVKYLVCVLRANMRIEQQNTGWQEVYELIAEQIKTLSINQQKCFDKVCLCKYQYDLQFDLTVNEMFYMLVKQKMSRFLYIYKDLDGKDVKVAIANTGNI